MSNRSMLFTVITVIIVGLSTAIGVNLLMGNADINKQPMAVIISHPETNIFNQTAIALRIDTGEKIKVAFSDSKIRLGSKVRLYWIDPLASPYPNAKLDSLEIK